MTPPPIQPPNFTAIPNVILDHMASLSEAELRVVLAVCRKTFGWHKERDVLSITQLEQLTGLSRQGVVNALGPLLEQRILDRVPAGMSFAYTILVNEIDQSNYFTSQDNGLVNTVDQTSQLCVTELVNTVDTQKKGNKQEKKERATPPTPPAKTKTKAPAPKTTVDPSSTVSGTAQGAASPPSKKECGSNLNHPAVQLYHELARLTPNAVQQALIIEAVGDDPGVLECWRTSCEYWMQKGYRPHNVADLVDYFQKKTTEQARKREPYQYTPAETPWRAADAMTPEETGKYMAKLIQEHAEKRQIPPVFGKSA